ncbi:hypothetical protein GTO91_07435 [Heliobacterium undosum]|uniref:Fibronectin type-III domain-containing protein n=1 Tax=Heliomicrobium undosum TaxID=121734 RepID=A0A845L724_9FIRM|nr:IPT/TIG domain-containing protein [Heliomicrobium undosum]MZP29538.1 hypothetical protein [Heliomicrobium undosum]
MCYKKMHKTIALLLMIVMLFGLIPHPPAQAAPFSPQIERFTYSAPSVSNNASDVSVTFSVYGSGFTDVSRLYLADSSGVRTEVTLARPLADSLISGTVTLPSTLHNQDLTAVFVGNDGSSRSIADAFHFRIKTTRVWFSPPSASANSPSLVNLYFYNYQDEPDISKVSGQEVYFSTTRYQVQSADPTPTNYLAKITSDSTGGKIIFYTPAMPDGAYSLSLRRVLTYTNSGVTTIITETANPDSSFWLTGSWYDPPVLSGVTAEPLSDEPDAVSLQYYGAQQSASKVKVTVAANKLESYDLPDGTTKSLAATGHYLIIRGRQYELQKIGAEWIAFIDREIVDKTSRFEPVALLRSDHVSSNPHNVTLWTDPYHRDNNTLTMNLPAPNGQIWLKLPTSAADIQDIEITGNAQAFGGILSDNHNRDVLRVIFAGGPNASEDSIRGALASPGNNEAIIVDKQAESIRIRLQTGMTLPPNQEVYCWIVSDYGRSKLDSHIYFYNDETPPLISDVTVQSINDRPVTYVAANQVPDPTKPEERASHEKDTVYRNAKKAVIELTGSGFVQDRMTVQIGSYTFAPGSSLLQVDGANGKMTVTLSAAMLSSLPVDVPITITKGTGQGAKTVTQSVTWASKTDFNNNYLTFGQNTGRLGFRFLSVPDFPSLVHSASDAERWNTRKIDPTANNYRANLSNIIEAPTQVFDWRGNHIIKLKNGQDFYRVKFAGSNPETDPDFWLQPKVAVQYTDGTNTYITETKETYVPDTSSTESTYVVSSELYFRLPDLSQMRVNGTGALIPAATFTGQGPYYADIVVQNPDGQKVTLPKAIEIVNRGATRPQIDSLFPNQVPNDNGKDVLIKGQNFRNSAADPPYVFMGFWPATSSFIDNADVKFKSVTQTFLYTDLNQVLPVNPRKTQVVVVNPDGTASNLADLIILQQRPNPPSITNVSPPYGPANSNARPYIFVTGTNFQPGGSGRLLSRIYLDEILALDLTTTPAPDPATYSFSNNLITFQLPNIPSPPTRKNMTVILQFSDDTASWYPFDTYVAPAMTVGQITPAFGPSKESGLPMADVIIKGSGFGTAPEVYVGGVKVTQFNAAPIDTQLSFRVPPLSAGKYKVTVVNPTVKSVGSAPNDFEYLPASDSASPILTTVWVDNAQAPPAALRSVGGQSVILEGNLFFVPGTEGDATKWPRVFIGGKEVAAGSFTETPTTSRIAFTSPSTDPGFFASGETSKSVNLQVLRSDGAIVSKTITITRSTPQIESVSPCGADVDDTPRPTIYITGVDIQDGMIVRFGNDVPGRTQPGDGPYDVSNTRIGSDAGDGVELVSYDSTTKRGVFRVTAPNLTALYNAQNEAQNWLTVRVYNPDAQVAQWSRKFHIFQDKEGPKILSIEPNAFSAKGGGTARIRMTNLLIDYRDKTQWPYFSFGGITVSPNDANTDINYPVDPAKDMSREPVRLIQAGNSATDEWIFDVVIPAYPLSDNVDSLNVEVLAINRLDCTSTTGVGRGSITYTREAGALQLVSITPAKSPIEGNITAVITARLTADSTSGPGSKGFIVKNNENPKVYFGTSEATVISLTPTELTVRVPAHEAGKVDVIVINPDKGQGTLPQAFTYSQMPLIESIKPSSGPQAGGIAAVIKGRGFLPNAKVTFGSTAATVKNITTNEIQLVVPAGPAIPDGDVKVAVDVTVTNSDGGSHTLTSGFTYYKEGGLPSESPEILAKALSRDRIRVSWPAVNMATAYEVQMSEGERGNYRLYEVVAPEHVQADQVYVIVKGLQSNTKYWFRVRAISTAGPGPWSDEASATTTDEQGWSGFEQPESQVVTMPGGAKLILRKSVEKYYDLRTGAMGAAKVKAVTFSPEAQGFSQPVLLDSGDWKVLLPPLSLKYNAGSMTDSHSTVQVGPAPPREAEKALMLNRYRQPISSVYEIQLTYEKDSKTFTPAAYGQAITLTLNYQPAAYGRRPVMYYYDGATRTWQKVDGYADSVAVSAAISRAGYYAVFAD